MNNNVVGKGVSIRFWPWDVIDCARTGRQTVRGREFTVLSLRDDQAADLATFALRDRPTIAEIQAYFEHHGKACDIE